MTSSSLRDRRRTSAYKKTGTNVPRIVSKFPNRIASRARTRKQETVGNSRVQHLRAVRNCPLCLPRRRASRPGFSGFPRRPAADVRSVSHRPWRSRANHLPDLSRIFRRPRRPLRNSATPARLSSNTTPPIVDSFRNANCLRNSAITRNAKKT